MANAVSYDPFYQQLLEQLKQQGWKAPPGPNDWVNNIQPDGSLAGAQVTATPPGYGTPKPPGLGQQVAQTGGQVTGAALGQQAASWLSGSAPSLSAPGAVSSGSTAAVGSGSGYPMTEALLQGGSQEGIAQGMSAAPTQASWFASIAPMLQWAGVAGIGAYTAKTGLDAWKNSQYSAGNPMTGLKEGIKAAGPLNFVPVLGQLPWIAGALGAQFGSGKDKDQHMRDQVREELVKTGFLNPDFTLDLGNGETLDFGKDGNARLPNEGADPLTGQDWRHYYDVDWSKEGAGGIVAAVNPLAAAFARGDKKLTRDFAGYLTNAAMKSDNPLEAIQGFIEKAGMDHDKIYGLIHLMSKSQGGNLDDSLADAYKNGLDQLYGVGAYEGKGGQFGNPDIRPGEKSDGGQKPQSMPAMPVKPDPSVDPKMSAQGPKPQGTQSAIKPQSPASTPTAQKPTGNSGGIKSPFMQSPQAKPKPAGFLSPPRARGLGLLRR